MSTYQGVAHNSRGVLKFLRAIDGEIEQFENGRSTKLGVWPKYIRNDDFSKILGMASPGVGNVEGPWESVFNTPRGSQRP